MRFALSDKSHNWDMKNQINIPRLLPNIPFYSGHVSSSSGFYRSFTSCVKTYNKPDVVKMQADVFCSYADAMRGKVTLRMFSDK